MKFKLLFLTLLAFLLFVNIAQAQTCGNGLCQDDLNETTATCCLDCGCPANQTCYGDFWYTKTCIAKTCGDEFCDETLDENSVPEEYWKNCCDDCGCHGSDKWETEQMEDHEIEFYTPTDDRCYDNQCHGCNLDKNCNDNDNCTIDECLFTTYINKSACYNVPITACVDNDTCCPAGCDYNNDSDCIGICGDKKCSMSEDCEVCEIDCGCDLGYECIDRVCQESKSHCEIRGEVKDKKFCNGRQWIEQYELEHECAADYQCQSGLCKDSICSEAEKERAHLTKIGIIAIVVACIIAYLIVVVIKFGKSNK